MAVLIAVARADMIIATTAQVVKCMAVFSAAFWATWWIVGRYTRRDKP